MISYKNSVLKNNKCVVTSDYKTRNNKRPTHNGIDLVSYHLGYNCTDYIVAIADGKISISRKSVILGNYIEINHDNNIRTMYLHMKDNSLKFKVGDYVKKGQILGYMGSTGNSTGAHLHFAVKENDIYVDPLPYLIGKKIIEENKKELKSVEEIVTEVIAGKWKNNPDRKKLLESAGYDYRIIQDEVNKFLSNKENKNDDNIIYVVKSGDNLSKIAKKFDTTWKKIYNDNKEKIGDNPNLIKPEQKLVIKK